MRAQTISAATRSVRDRWRYGARSLNSRMVAARPTCSARASHCGSNTNASTNDFSRYAQRAGPVAGRHVLESANGGSASRILRQGFALRLKYQHIPHAPLGLHIVVPEISFQHIAQHQNLPCSHACALILFRFQFRFRILQSKCDWRTVRLFWVNLDHRHMLLVCGHTFSNR